MCVFHPRKCLNSELLCTMRFNNSVDFLPQNPRPLTHYIPSSIIPNDWLYASRSAFSQTLNSTTPPPRPVCVPTVNFAIFYIHDFLVNHPHMVTLVLHPHDAATWRWMNSDRSHDDQNQYFCFAASSTEQQHRSRGRLSISFTCMQQRNRTNQIETIQSMSFCLPFIREELWCLDRSVCSLCPPPVWWWWWSLLLVVGGGCLCVV